MRRLVILRPEPGASETLTRAEKRGLPAIKMPLFRMEPIPWTPPDPARFDGLLLTSANAVREAVPQLRALQGLPAFAVGEATAEALRAAGFTVAATGQAGVEELLASIDPSFKLLHLCGEDRHPHTARQSVTPVVVYRAAPRQPEGLEELAEAVVMVHSPRAGRRVAELVRDRSAIRIAAISGAAAAACGPDWAEVSVADAPRDEALLSLAESLCKGPAPE